MATASAKPAAAAAAASSPPAASGQGFWEILAQALAQRITAPPRPRQASSTSLLDFILVVGALILIAGGLYGLFMVPNIPKETLPIIASLLSFISGSILGAYAGYRWGASEAMKRQNAPAAPNVRAAA
ncbi:MAG: hypothetical protein V4466_12015 [Pseudomonadota bacterium]